MHMASRSLFLVLFLSWLVAPARAIAGNANPDLSVIGQPRLTWTDDASTWASKRPVFDLGEVEVLLTAPLNPYARASFTFALANGEAAVEEGYFVLERGLPGGLQLRGGRFRQAFGRMNATHPHQDPFAERPGAVTALLPSDEGFLDTGVELSWRLPVAGDWAVDLKGAALQGDVFRVEPGPGVLAADGVARSLASDASGREDEPRTAWLARATTFAPFDDRSGLELGVSAAGGTNEVATAARTRLLGVDAKLKLWTAEDAQLVLQAEGLWQRRERSVWDGVAAAHRLDALEGNGQYLFADYAWRHRFDVGALVGRVREPGADEASVEAGVFAGLALMEETTLFRLDWRRVEPPAGEPIQTVTLRVVFSMGPHKAHSF